MIDFDTLFLNYGREIAAFAPGAVFGLAYGIWMVLEKNLPRDSNGVADRLSTILIAIIGAWATVVGPDVAEPVRVSGGDYLAYYFTKFCITGFAMNGLCAFVCTLVGFMVGFTAKFATWLGRQAKQLIMQTTQAIKRIAGQHLSLSIG